ncbi:DegT/DnrJ/EryC1/StrS family aminotransferase [Guggenheimella bovis]
MKIPLIDLKAQVQSLEPKLSEAVVNTLKEANYILGSEVKKLEQSMAELTGSTYALGVASGTDALVLSLRALGIGEGDEVITSPFTFFATAEAIAMVGAKPVFVDVEEDTFNIDTTKIEASITEDTKAIIAVHLFGQPADMDEINEIAKAHELFVIEDACQAIGATYKGRPVGSLSDIACFSFFPTKNLGGAGDGGMVVTSDEHLFKLVRALRAHGSGQNGLEAYRDILGVELKDHEETGDSVYQGAKYYNYLVGYNSRLDELQAAVLNVKLPMLAEWNQKRRFFAKEYDQSLSKTNLVTPFIKPERESVYHMYVLKSEERDKVVKNLNDRLVATGIYYPVPLHLQKAFEYLGFVEGDLPVAEYLSKRTFAIPIYPELGIEERSYILSSLKDSL